MLRQTALVEEAGANWPQSVGANAPPEAALLVQVCHGAPGVICCLRHLPVDVDPQLEEILRRGGELIWHAGPLIKGPGLCHGTAGNGYAFLELYRRTGDRKWLDRARAFAMHGIYQSEQMRARYHQGRYSLWTGDQGLAVYLWHCIQGAGGFPGIDLL